MSAQLTLVSAPAATVPAVSRGDVALVRATTGPVVQAVADLAGALVLRLLPTARPSAGPRRVVVAPPARHLHAVR